MTFHDLHYGDRPLVLPNAWDVPSALAFLDAGFEAIGTTSFGVASSLGRPDGGRSTREANLALARALSRLPCHISVDIEDGYADEPERVADYVAELNVAGINIEDSTAEKLISPEAHAAKVAAIKRRCPERVRQRPRRHVLAREDATVAATLGAPSVRRGGRRRRLRPRRDGARRAARADRAHPGPAERARVPGALARRTGELGVRRVSTGSLPVPCGDSCRRRGRGRRP